MKFFVYIFLISLSFTSYGHNSAGGRGGGTGVICGDGELKLIEEFEMKQQGLKIKVPKTRNGVRAFMRRKLNKHQKLLKAWEKIWESNGEFYDWKGRTYAANHKRIADGLGKFLALDFGNYEFGLESDDFFEVPKGCEKVQLSIFWEGKPYRFIEISPRLSTISKRLLELHESLYMVGTYEYGHIFPHKTRELLISLNKTGEDLSAKVASFEVNSDEASLAQNISSLYVLNSLDMKEFQKCPTALTILAESNEELRMMKVKFERTHGKMKILDIASQTYSPGKLSKNIILDDLKIDVNPSGVQVTYAKADGHECVYKQDASKSDKILVLKDLNQFFRALELINM